jgi:membrane protease YdiL (CAAX protease family)
LTVVPPTTPATTDPAPTHGPSGPITWLGSAFTHPVRRRVPRWGSLAQPRNEGRRLSTAPRVPTAPRAPAAPWVPTALRVPTASPLPTAPAAPGVEGVVVVGGLAFLLARTALGGLSTAAPVLVVGYLALLAGALVAGEGNVDRARRGAPLGWEIVLGVGLLGVVGATVVGGPVGDRRVGAVAGGIALLAAVAEEALFRRLLYDRLLRFGVVVAVIGSAVVFAVVHLPAYGLVAMPVDLGAALLLSWQRYASGRWTVPAVTHVVANLLAVT